MVLKYFLQDMWVLTFLLPKLSQVPRFTQICPKGQCFMQTEFRASEDKDNMNNDDIRCESHLGLLPLFHDIYRLSTMRWHCLYRLDYY